MMSGPDFTPTEYIIRLAYRHTSLQNTTPAPTTEELDAEFDRAIAKIKADAVREARSELDAEFGRISEAGLVEVEQVLGLLASAADDQEVAP